MTEGTRSAERSRARWWVAAAGAVALSCAFVPTAQAALDEPELLAAGAVLGGKQSWSSELNISGQGKLTVQAYDLGVPRTLVAPLDALSFSVSNSTNVFASHSGSGTLTFDISASGLYMLTLSAVPSAQSRFGLGLVSWSATFERDVSAVPLPATFWLLITGLAWATGMQRKRAKLIGAVAPGKHGRVGWRWPALRNQSVTYGT